MQAGLAQLHTLAILYGARTTYLDMISQTRSASVESLLAVLKALGAPLSGLSDVPAAIKEKRQQQWLEPLEPVMVVPDNEMLTVNLKLPSSSLNTPVKATLTLENGQKQDLFWRIEESSIIHSVIIDGRRFHNVRLYVPGKFPAGYYHFSLELPGLNAEALIISSPLKTFQPHPAEKIWGTFAPLYALHSGRSWGAGDFSDLNEFLDLTIQHGGRLVGTLPLLAGFFDKDYGPGPYLPASRFFWNEFYLDVRQIPELNDCPEAVSLLQNVDFQKSLSGLRSSGYVNYELQLDLKRQVLEKLTDYFFKEKPLRFREFYNYIQNNPRLAEYAAFREAGEKHGLKWTEWPEQTVNSHPVELDQAKQTARYFMYTQWLTEIQINSLARKAKESSSYLYLDMPVGIHPYSYDVWKERGVFVCEARAGAPPDPVFTNGQNWDFPPLHPENIRRQGYRYFIEGLRKQLSTAGMLRIDHLMNFHRLYWIPRGAPAGEGVYINYKADEFYAILTLESTRYRSVIVGEDLGLVPPEVRPLMEKHGLFRMFVGQYELIAENQLGQIPMQATAGLNTHDMFPFAAFWQEQDILERQKMKLLNANEAAKELEQRRYVKRTLISILQYRGLTSDLAQDTEATLRAVLSLLAASPVYALILNLEDLWLETKPQNVPGTRRKQNWTLKTAFPLEKLEKSKEINQLLEEVNRLRKGVNNPQ
jgi:4-alpha-glucanotransferase